jgi:hypothetical protein
MQQRGVGLLLHLLMLLLASLGLYFFFGRRFAGKG